MSEDNKCVFCDFDRRFVIDENKSAFAAHFDCAIKRGHIVVALKEHETSLSELTREQAGDLMRLASEVARKAEPLAHCRKFYLVSIADEVPHYHVHLLPLKEGDPLIGKHVMGAEGWKGEAGEPVTGEDIKEFINNYKQNSEKDKQ